MKINGYKTYIAAVALICYAVGGLIAGQISGEIAIQSILIALGMMGIGHKIDKK